MSQHRQLKPSTKAAAGVGDGRIFPNLFRDCEHWIGRRHGFVDRKSQEHRRQWLLLLVLVDSSDLFKFVRGRRNKNIFLGQAYDLNKLNLERPKIVPLLF